MKPRVHLAEGDGLDSRPVAPLPLFDARHCEWGRLEMLAFLDWS